MDTIRVLVERGSADPLARIQSKVGHETDVTLVDSDVSLEHRGVLEYLLRQVDLDQFDELASTVTWGYAVERHSLTYAAVLSRLVQLARLSQQPGYLQTAFSAIVNSFRSVFLIQVANLSLDQSTERVLENPLKELIEAGADPNAHFKEWTVLRRLLEPWYYRDTTFENFDRCVNGQVELWLKLLNACGIDVLRYLEKEYYLYWNSSDYPFRLQTLFSTEERNLAYTNENRIKATLERFLFFDFTNPDPTKALTIFHKMVSWGPAEESMSMPGSWIDYPEEDRK